MSFSGQVALYNHLLYTTLLSRRLVVKEKKDPGFRRPYESYYLWIFFELDGSQEDHTTIQTSAVTGRMAQPKLYPEQRLGLLLCYHGEGEACQRLLPIALTWRFGSDIKLLVQACISSNQPTAPPFAHPHPHPRKRFLKNVVSVLIECCLPYYDFLKK